MKRKNYKDTDRLEVDAISYDRSISSFAHEHVQGIKDPGTKIELDPPRKGKKEDYWPIDC